MATKYIDNISFTRLSNAYHVSYFSNVKAGIDKYQAETLGIGADIYERFTDALDLEQDIVNRARSSAFTQELAEYDRVRDKYFRRIFYKLKNAENDSMNEKMTSELITKIQVHLLNQYGLNLVNDANQKETAKLRGFIKDVREVIPDNLEDLEIANDITILESANDNYEKTYMARVSEQAAYPATNTLREATEAAYLHITYSLAALANVTSGDTAAALRAKLCSKVIDEINVLIKDFKQKAYTSSSSSKDDEEISDEDVNNQEEEI